MLWIHRDEQEELRGELKGEEGQPEGPVSLGGAPAPDQARPPGAVAAVEGGLLGLLGSLDAWFGVASRVCGGPVYLLVAAASPHGFATYDSAARHGNNDACGNLR